MAAWPQKHLTIKEGRLNVSGVRVATMISSRKKDKESIYVCVEGVPICSIEGTTAFRRTNLSFLPTEMPGMGTKEVMIKTAFLRGIPSLQNCMALMNNCSTESPSSHRGFFDRRHRRKACSSGIMYPDTILSPDQYQNVHIVWDYPQ